MYVCACFSVCSYLCVSVKDDSMEYVSEWKDLETRLAKISPLLKSNQLPRYSIQGSENRAAESTNGKELLCKSEDQSLLPQNHIKKADMVLYAYNLSIWEVKMVHQPTSLA